MASHCQSQPPAHRCQDVYEPPEPADAVDNEAKRPPRAQRDYDFLERPSEDYFCPVTLELVLEPHQTACCGHHLSHDAAARLQREGKPCPVCKEPKLTTMADKFFKRKVKELKSRCPHKESGCEWVGEVGSLDQHDRACPKRPWQCEYCQERGLYEIQEKHMFTCTHYPTPCPNKCDVGTVARCKLDEHIAVCALQLVECEFSHAGCKVVVERKEMARHMEEEAQQHLLTATLLNLSLTREMRAEMQGKMEKMEGKMEAMEGKMEGKMEAMEGKMEAMAKRMEGKAVEMEVQLRKKVEEMEGRLQGRMKEIQEKMEGQITQLQEQVTNLRACVLSFAGLEFTLTGYDPSNTDWYSVPFHVPSHGQYKFQLNIDNDSGGGNIRAWLKLMKGENDDNLPWPITVMGRLTLLNQLGERDHHSVHFHGKLSKTDRIPLLSISSTFIPTKNLTHDDQQGTQYLKDGCLNFRLHIKISPQ